MNSVRNAIITHAYAWVHQYECRKKEGALKMDEVPDYVHYFYIEALKKVSPLSETISKYSRKRGMPPASEELE